jgi:hypothetical protein
MAAGAFAERRVIECHARSAIAESQQGSGVRIGFNRR